MRQQASRGGHEICRHGGARPDDRIDDAGEEADDRERRQRQRRYGLIPREGFRRAAAWRLAPAEGEARRPLLGEGDAPFREVRPQRRLLGQRAERRGLDGHAAGDRLDRPLAAADRGLAEIGEPARVAEHGVAQRRLDSPVDQADRQRLVGFDPSPGEEDVLGARRADEFDETAGLGVAVDEPEPRRRDGEIGVGGAKSQVAGERHGETAADDVALQRPRWSDGRSPSAPADRPGWRRRNRGSPPRRCRPRRIPKCRRRR